MPTVLIIDDEATTRTFCRLLLEREGHRVREAADGQEGLASYLREPADVVLCDLLMPERGGLGTINELRRACPGVKVVAMSGGGRRVRGAEMLEVARSLGATGVISKPFGRAELVAAVGRALGGPTASPGPTARPLES
jgi:CheY-like chemotaxis protein